MSEFRSDPISGRQVIIAPQRSARPPAGGTGGGKDLQGREGRDPGPAYVESCPFCAGNEQMTPPETMALGRSAAVRDGRGWKVRVVPNRYPAVERSAQGQLTAESSFPSGYGAHEVLIETPVHNRHPGNFPPRQMELVIEALYRRGEALSRDPGLRYLQFYRNHRREAGASMEHPHSQLVALPFVPALLRRELERSQDLYLSEGGCPFCRLEEEENRFGQRIVAQNEGCSAFIPAAARSPFETWILPRRHRASFLETTVYERAALAAILEEVLGIMARALGDAPYNYYLRTAPLRSPPLPYYHWHLELLPRVGVTAGFEMGSGVYINEIAPEEAARFIREKGKREHEAAPRKDLLYSCTAQPPACGEPGRGL